MFDLSGQSEVRKKEKQIFSPFPEFLPSLGVGPRIDLLPRLRAQQQQQQQQPVPQPSQPLPIAPSSSTWDKIKALDIKGLGNELIKVGLPHGLSQRGTVKEEKYMANAFANKPGPLQSYYQGQLANQQKDQEYLKANPVNSLPAMIGEQLTQIPLWMAGEAGVNAIGKGISKLAPSFLPLAEKVGSKLPGIVKGGLMDAATYGAVVAPTETTAQGDGLQGLLNREKQLPGVFLGGTLARGAFKGIGKGIEGAKGVFNPRDVPLPTVANETIPVPIGESRITPAITPNEVTALPEPQSKIIIGKAKDPFSFKNAWDKFYTSVVNTQQPIVNAAKVAGSDMGKLASNTKNVSGIVDHNFLTAMVDKNGNKVGESLQKTVEAIPKGQEEEFWTYMSQRHNIDRAREGKSVQANYTPEMSTDAVKIAEQTHPEYKAIGDGVVNWIDKFMNTWGVDTGIVNKDIYAGLRDTYKSYFPTQRDFSTLEKSIPEGLTSKFADQRTPIRKATGSSRDIINPTENIMNLVNRTIRTAKYNEVGQSLLKSVRSNPEKLKPFAEAIPTKDGMFSNLDNVVTVLENGNPTYLKINDKALLDSMNGLPKSIGELPFKLGKPIQLFKDLITQKNPIFALRNISRDIPTAYAYGSEPNPIKFTKGLLGAGKDILTNGPRLQKYQAVGGGGANFFSSGDVTKSAAELTNIGKRDAFVSKISSMVGDSRPGKVVSGTADAVLHPIKSIEKFNNLTEAAPRLAEFNRVLNKTGDVTKALYASNDVTVNFSRGGNITKNIDKAVPYLNAGVQGLDKFFRGFKDPKTALATIVKSGVAITVPDLALYMVNKDNPNYQAEDNRTKDTYYLIPKSDGTFIKIPKARELGVLFGSLFERGLRAAEGQKDSFKGLGNAMATSFAPANPLENNIFSPIQNLKSNKDFAGRAIVPQGMLMDKRSPYLQYDDKTTSIAKAVGELSGLSPKQLDYLVKSYTGVIGQLGIPLAVPGGSPLKALKTQFISDPTFNNQVTTDFYDKLDKLSAAAVDKNILDKIPSEDLTDEENMRNSMNGVSTALSRGNKLISKIQSSNDISKDAQIKAIKTQMLDLTSKAVSADSPSSMQSVEDDSKGMFGGKKAVTTSPLSNSTGGTSTDTTSPFSSKKATRSKDSPFS
jgi:hypothetical protein